MLSSPKMATIVMLAGFQVTFNCVILFGLCSYDLCVLKFSFCLNLKRHHFHLKTIVDLPQRLWPQFKRFLL